jgi:hypothetical protein
VSINGVIRPLEAEQSLPALQIVPELVGAVSEHWVYRYIAGTEHNEKKYTGRIKYVAKRHEHYIAKLQQGFQSHTGKARDTLFRFTLSTFRVGRFFWFH